MDPAFDRLCGVFRRLESGVSMVLSEEGWSEADQISAGPHLGLLTSGTTGPRKQVRRLWSELKASVRVSQARRSWTWATGFRPTSYAGVQLAVQAWLEGAQLVFLDRPCTETWAVLAGSRANALSATPTFLDLLLTVHPETADWTPQHVTLGGEVLRRAVGKRIDEAFPSCTRSVVYASTELGVIFRTTRMDGFYEVDRLDPKWTAWRLKSDQEDSNSGVLEVCDGVSWFSTLDRARMVLNAGSERGAVGNDGGALVEILGRSDAVANVGGVKVHLEDVEAAAETQSTVRRACAWAEPSALLGQVVGLRVEWLQDSLGRQTQEEFQQALRGRLPKPAWPRVWEFGAVGVGENGKRVNPRRSGGGGL